jgi:hypothetical protein
LNVYGAHVEVIAPAVQRQNSTSSEENTEKSQGAQDVIIMLLKTGFTVVLGAL